MVKKTNSSSATATEGKEDKNVHFHKEVVAGVIQLIIFFNTRRKESKKSIGFGEAYKAGIKGRDEEAHSDIFEFLKDGIVSMSVEEMEKVANGDYSNVWKSANDYLKMFGHKEVEPVELSLNF